MAVFSPLNGGGLLSNGGGLLPIEFPAAQQQAQAQQFQGVLAQAPGIDEGLLQQGMTPAQIQQPGRAIARAQAAQAPAAGDPNQAQAAPAAPSPFDALRSAFGGITPTWGHLMAAFGHMLPESQGTRTIPPPAASPNVAGSAFGAPGAPGVS